MTPAEQKIEYDKLITRARKAGLLKFEKEGIAVIELPAVPPAPPVACSIATPAVVSS